MMNHAIDESCANLAGPIVFPCSDRNRKGNALINHAERKDVSRLTR